ncbi:thymidine phosphorylase family protein [Maricaulis sp. CAU 1757]
MTRRQNTLRLKWLGIDTGLESVIYIRPDCPVCRSEGFGVQARVEVRANGRSVIATVNVIDAALLQDCEAGLSREAARRLEVEDGAELTVHHTRPVESMSAVRAKIYGHAFSETSTRAIVRDITAGLYSDVQLSALVTSCAGSSLDRREMVHLTHAMIEAGDRLDWDTAPVVDKHCVGGLPGNRTTPIIVPIMAAAGLTMPKTSSRAITSPAGTVDVMETLTEVSLSMQRIREVVNREGGCMVWGGAVHLSPADDILIRIERALDLDSEGQLVASVLSKKAAAGSTHVVLDLPTGPTAKIRTPEAARIIADHLGAVGEAVGVTVRCVISDGRQPVGRGIGPALEAHDVLAVLQNAPDAPRDLRDRALALAGELLDLAGRTAAGDGLALATALLDDGRAWQKFQAICEAQGGLREPPVAPYRHDIVCSRPGRVESVDNRLLARAAKLAGAPFDRSAGISFRAPLESLVDAGDVLFTVHAESPGELDYAREFVESHADIVKVGDV